MAGSMMRVVTMARLLLPLATGGCGLLLGLDEFVDAPASAGQGGTGGGGASGADGGGIPGQGGAGGQGGGPESGTAVWSSIYGDGNNQRPAAIAVGPDGSIFVTGVFEGAVQFGEPDETLIGAGANDIFLAKFDREGKHIWSQRFGDSSSQRSTGIAVDSSGDVVIVGELWGTANFGKGDLQSAGSADAFVAKFSASGEPMWSRRFGDATTQRAEDVAVDPVTGDVVMVGWFGGTMNFGVGTLTSAGNNDVFVAKLMSETGSAVWGRRFGDASSQRGASVRLDSIGGILMGGHFDGTMNLDSISLVTDSGMSAFVAKLDSEGEALWAKQTSNTGGSTVEAMAVDFAGNVLVSGAFDLAMNLGCGTLESIHYNDIFLAKLDPLGACLWSKRFGGQWQDQLTELAVDGSGNVLLTGQFTTTIHLGGESFITRGGSEVFLAKFDPSGAHLWSTQIGGELNQESGQIAMSPGSDAIAFAAATFGSLDLGTGPLMSAGGPDIVLGSLAP